MSGIPYISVVLVFLLAACSAQADLSNVAVWSADMALAPNTHSRIHVANQKVSFLITSDGIIDKLQAILTNSSGFQGFQAISTESGHIIDLAVDKSESFAYILLNNGSSFNSYICDSNLALSSVDSFFFNNKQTSLIKHHIDLTNNHVFLLMTTKDGVGHISAQLVIYQLSDEGHTTNKTIVNLLNYEANATYSFGGCGKYAFVYVANHDGSRVRHFRVALNQTVASIDIASSVDILQRVVGGRKKNGSAKARDGAHHDLFELVPDAFGEGRYCDLYALYWYNRSELKLAKMPIHAKSEIIPISYDSIYDEDDLELLTSSGTPALVRSTKNGGISVQLAGSKSTPICANDCAIEDVEIGDNGYLVLTFEDSKTGTYNYTIMSSSFLYRGTLPISKETVVDSIHSSISRSGNAVMFSVVDRSTKQLTLFGATQASGLLPSVMRRISEFWLQMKGSR